MENLKKTLEEENKKLENEIQRLIVENEDLKNLNTFIWEWLSFKILWEQKFKKVLVITWTEKNRRTMPNYIKQLKEFIDNTEHTLLETIKNKK